MKIYQKIKKTIQPHAVTLFLSICLLGIGAGATAVSLQQMNRRQAQNVTAIKPLSNQAYKKLKDEFVAIVNKTDPRTAMKVLRKKMQADPAVLRDCHDFSHDIGQAAYRKYLDFGKAAEYQDEICTAGYIHGVMQAYFATETDIFNELPTICSSSRPNSFSRWECVHGVGHGLMYATQNNLPQSLSACSVYDAASDKSACVNGVFMENFTADQALHPTKYRTSQDPFYPCAEQEEANKLHCYFTAPDYFLTLHPDYREAFRWCETAEKEYRDICVEGLGTQIMRRHIDNPKAAEKQCELGTMRQKQNCVTGIVDYYIAHFGSLEPAGKFCKELKAENARQCEALILLHEDQF